MEKKNLGNCVSGAQNRIGNGFRRNALDNTENDTHNNSSSRYSWADILKVMLKFR